MNPHVPISSLWGRARTELPGWIVSFPCTFCHKKKSLLFPANLDASPAPHPRCFITQAFLFENGIKVRGLWISIPWFPCPESDCNNYSFMPAHWGWCAADTFPQQLCCCSSEVERIVGASRLPQPRKPSSQGHKAFFFLLFFPDYLA